MDSLSDTADFMMGFTCCKPWQYKQLDCNIMFRLPASMSSPCASMRRVMIWRWWAVSRGGGAGPEGRCLPIAAAKSAHALLLLHTSRRTFGTAWCSTSVTGTQARWEFRHLHPAAPRRLGPWHQLPPTGRAAVRDEHRSPSCMRPCSRLQLLNQRRMPRYHLGPTPPERHLLCGCGQNRR